MSTVDKTVDIVFLYLAYHGNFIAVKSYDNLISNDSTIQGQNNLHV